MRGVSIRAVPGQVPGPQGPRVANRLYLELSAATAFIVLALLGMWLAPAFIAVGLVLHGFWDLAHRPRAITTKLPSWYPPFFAAYDFVFAGAFLVLARDLAARAR